MRTTRPPAGSPDHDGAPIAHREPSRPRRASARRATDRVIPCGVRPNTRCGRLRDHRPRNIAHDHPDHRRRRPPDVSVRHLLRRPPAPPPAPRPGLHRGTRPRHPGVPRLRRAGGRRRPVRHRRRHRRRASGLRRDPAGTPQPPRRIVHRRPGHLDRPHDRLDRAAGDPRHRQRSARPVAEGRGRRSAARPVGQRR